MMQNALTRRCRLPPRDDAAGEGQRPAERLRWDDGCGRAAADYAYILPALGVMLLVIGYPIYDTIYLSFFATPPSLAMSQKTFVGFDNYTRILTSDAFLRVTWNTSSGRSSRRSSPSRSGSARRWRSTASSLGAACYAAFCWCPM